MRRVFPDDYGEILADPPRADTTPTRSKALTDDDLMPFGKYKGHPMREVEVGWLHWYWWESQVKPLCPVVGYIRNNLAALKSEKPDLIWE